MTDSKKHYEILELLAWLSGFKDVIYEVEHKDGRPSKIKNIRISEIDLSKSLKEFNF